MLSLFEQPAMAMATAAKIARLRIRLVSQKNRT
jgi:hypothetical protein